MSESVINVEAIQLLLKYWSWFSSQLSANFSYNQLISDTLMVFLITANQGFLICSKQWLDSIHFIFFPIHFYSFILFGIFTFSFQCFCSTGLCKSDVEIFIGPFHLWVFLELFFFGTEIHLIICTWETFKGVHHHPPLPPLPLPLLTHNHCQWMQNSG